MKQIDLKQPKYILPIIILPFVLGLGWLVGDMFESVTDPEAAQLAQTEDLNLDIPDADLENKEVKSKLGALKDAFKKSSDYSSIQAIERDEEVSEVEDYGSLYTSDEIREIDSLNQATMLAQARIDVAKQSYEASQTSPDRSGSREAPSKSRMQEEMELFKMQMSYLDSLQNPKPSQQQLMQQQEQLRQMQEQEEQTVDVVKAANPSEKYFNTIGKDFRTPLITAILDENLTVKQGSRVRVRLLDDILVEDMLLRKGVYLYGNVSGFKAQRVMINITSIMIDGQHKKVDLSIYDNDGQEGLYVPSSSFRELSKNIGGQVSNQNIQFNSQAQGVEQFAFGALQDIYRSTTQAVSKNIKSNKAKLKYNTQVFLINNNEKEN